MDLWYQSLTYWLGSTSGSCWVYTGKRCIRYANDSKATRKQAAPPHGALLNLGAWFSCVSTCRSTCLSPCCHCRVPPSCSRYVLSSFAPDDFFWVMLTLSNFIMPFSGLLAPWGFLACGSHCPSSHIALCVCGLGLKLSRRTSDEMWTEQKFEWKNRKVKTRRIAAFASILQPQSHWLWPSEWCSVHTCERPTEGRKELRFETVETHGSESLPARFYTASRKAWGIRPPIDCAPDRACANFGDQIVENSTPPGHQNGQSQALKVFWS